MIMAVKKCIAVIGLETEQGMSLVRLLAAGPYRLLLFKHEGCESDAAVDALNQEFPQAEIEIAGCAFDAAWEADAIVLAIDVREEEALARKIRQVATRKPVIRISSPGHIPTDVLRSLLPDSEVITAEDSKQVMQMI